MTFQDSSGINDEPVSSIVIQVVLSAFTLLTALSIRDTVMEGIKEISPKHTTKRLLFTLSTTLFFIFITVMIAYIWQQKVQ
jgi:hypothetical protein